MSPAYVYWVNYGGTIVMRAPIDGKGPTETVVPGAAPTGSTQNGGYIAVGKTAIYWTSGGSSATSGSVMTLPLDGGSPTPFATGQDGISDVAVDDTTVYWTNGNGGTVMAQAMAGGAAVTLADKQGRGPETSRSIRRACTGRTTPAAR